MKGEIEINEDVVEIKNDQWFRSLVPHYGRINNFDYLLNGF